jgi:hypothetical protein
VLGSPVGWLAEGTVLGLPVGWLGWLGWLGWVEDGVLPVADADGVAASNLVQ